MQTRPGKARHAVEFLSRPRFQTLSSVGQRWMLSVALAVFVAGAVVAGLRIDIEPGSIRLAFIAAAGLVGVPLTVIMNALEFSLSVRMVGKKTRFADALQTSVVSTAANLLPLPGGPLVRIQALRTLGGRSRDAISSTGLLGMLWLGTAGVAGGVMLAVAERLAIAVVFVVVGAVFVAVGALLLLGLPQVIDPWRTLGWALAIEAGMVVAAAMRLLLILWGIGAAASLSDTLVLAVSGVIAAAVGIFPGGLGLREAVAAGLAPLVGLTAALGFTATAADRVVGILVHAPIAWYLLMRRDRQERSSSEIEKDVDPGSKPNAALDPD